MAWRKRSGKLKELAEGLVKVGALQFGTFTLANGKESAYQVNLKGIASYPGMFKLVVQSMSELVSQKVPKANAVCGIPVAGLVIASPIALSLDKPMVYARLSRQPNERVLEGEVRPGWKVVVVDDLAATGRSILAAAKSVEQEGGHVKDAVVLIDRLEGARERLSKEGIALRCVTDVMELADTLLSMELIREADLKAIARSVGGRGKA
jgi:orotate phosphoribosyltransferase